MRLKKGPNKSVRPVLAMSDSLAHSCFSSTKLLAIHIDSNQHSKLLLKLVETKRPQNKTWVMVRLPGTIAAVFRAIGGFNRSVHYGTDGSINKKLTVRYVPISKTFRGEYSEKYGGRYYQWVLYTIYFKHEAVLTAYVKVLHFFVNLKGEKARIVAPNQPFQPDIQIIDKANICEVTDLPLVIHPHSAHCENPTSYPRHFNYSDNPWLSDWLETRRIETKYGFHLFDRLHSTPWRLQNYYETEAIWRAP